jgi:hypothetical protein
MAGGGGGFGLLPQQHLAPRPGSPTSAYSTRRTDGPPCSWMRMTTVRRTGPRPR